MSRIPSQAQCVFQGEIFSVWQWPQKMYDGSVETFEMIKRPDTVQVLAVEGEDILFCRQEQPDRPEAFLSLFGGRVDAGEKPLDAAKRELKEESGMVADEWEILWQEDPSGKIDWRVYTFIARGCQKVADQSLDAGEKIDVMRQPVSLFLNETVTQDNFRDWNIHRQLQKKGLCTNRVEELKRKLVG